MVLQGVQYAGCRYLKFIEKCDDHDGDGHVHCGTHLERRHTLRFTSMRLKHVSQPVGATAPATGASSSSGVSSSDVVSSVTPAELEVDVLLGGPLAEALQLPSTAATQLITNRPAGSGKAQHLVRPWVSVGGPQQSPCAQRSPSSPWQPSRPPPRAAAAPPRPARQ